MTVLSLHEYLQVADRTVHSIAQETGLSHQRLYQSRDQIEVDFDIYTDKIHKMWLRKNKVIYDTEAG